MAFRIIFLCIFLYMSFIIFDWSLLDLAAMIGVIIWAWIKTSDSE